MKRLFATALMVLALVLGLSLPGHAYANEEVREFLLSTAATEFAINGPAAEEVRDVRLRYLEKDDGARVYLLCGEFLPMPGSVKPVWTGFATLKTGGHEQWIGGQAAALCMQSLPLSSSPEDLSSELRGRLDQDPSAGE
jgi:hypothetical protein